jgi:GR25 family glycosyltransferase involved in LPS biosynthesis
MNLRLRLINLDRTPDRLAQFIARHPGVAIERFGAIDGAKIDRADCIRNGIITPDNRYRPGAIGLALSHITLWRQCAAGSEAFHVGEDDIILRADFAAMAAALLAPLSHWDIVLWTNNFDWPVKIRPAPGVGPVVLQYDPEEAKRELPRFPLATTRPTLARLVSAAGTGCYSVSPRGAARILTDCLPLGRISASYVAKPGFGWDNMGIDVEMSRHYDDWQAYLSVPPLAVAPNDQSSSTIRGHLAAMHDPAIANRAPG